MNSPKAQFVSALLFVLTVAAVSCAVINLRQQSLYHLPDDGVIWVDRPTAKTDLNASTDQNQVLALHVVPNGPGDVAGIRNGDVLKTIGGFSITKAKNVPQALAEIGRFMDAKYTIVRRGV